MINLSYFSGYILAHNGLKAVLKQLFWDKQKKEYWEPRKDKNPSDFSSKNMLIYKSMHLKESIFDKSILFFRLCTHWQNGLKASLKKLSWEKKKWEFRTKKTQDPLEFFPICLQIHYLQSYASRSINFWKSHLIIQVWCSSISRWTTEVEIFFWRSIFVHL